MFLWRVSPHLVLKPLFWIRTKAYGMGQFIQVLLCVSPQRRQGEFMTEKILKTGGCGHTVLRQVGKQSHEHGQGCCNQENPTSDPAQSSGKLDIFSEYVCRCFLAWRLLDFNQCHFDINQSPGKACRQAIRQQADSGVSFRTIPSGNFRTRWELSGVGPMLGQGTSSLGM